MPEQQDKPEASPHPATTGDVLARVAEIRARAEKATPGQWFVKSEGYGMDRLTPVAIVLGDTDSIDWTEDDYSFVTHARTDVPYLCDQLSAALSKPSSSPTTERERLAVVIADALARLDRLADHPTAGTKAEWDEIDKVLTPARAAYRSLVPR